MAYEPRIKNEATEVLVNSLLAVENAEECYRLLEDMCTVNEMLAMSQRLEVARMLRANVTYHEIVEKTGRIIRFFYIPITMTVFTPGMPRGIL